MNILVCIKQVPDTPHVDIDPKTGNLKREGADNKINLYDLYALETAFAIRKECGGYITAVSMGPPQAERAIREALTLGLMMAFYCPTGPLQVRMFWQLHILFHKPFAL